MGAITLDLVRNALANRQQVTAAAEGLMPAAVMLLLYPKDGEFCVLLNKRSMTVEHHKGEMSFPGGARDPEDADFEDTARRETEEEMGIARDDITILGRLDDNVTRSNFLVKGLRRDDPLSVRVQPQFPRNRGGCRNPDQRTPRSRNSALGLPDRKWREDFRAFLRLPAASGLWSHRQNPRPVPRHHRC